MAHIYNRNSNELQHVETPFNYKRGNPLPIDDYAVWTSLEDAQNYATSNPVAYVGQTLYVVDTTEKVVQAYVIKNEEGDLELQVDETLLSAKLQEVQDDVRGGVNYKGHINLKSGNYIPGLPLSAIFGIYYNIVDDDKVTLTSNYTVNNGWLYNIIVDGKYVTTDDPPITLENNDYLIIHNQSLSSIDVSSITTNTIDIIKALQEDYVRYNQIETLSSNLTGYTTNAIDTAISGLSTEKFQETNKFVKTITETSGKIDVEFGNVTSADFGSNKLKIEQVDALSDELAKFYENTGGIISGDATVDGQFTAKSNAKFDTNVSIDGNLVQGKNSSVTGVDRGVALGISAEVTQSDSFVWNGDRSIVGTYTSQGSIDGTFNINPEQGTKGFYIGTKNLSNIISTDVKLSVDSLSGTVDDISSALSTDYIDKIGTAKTEAFTNTTNKINELSNTLSTAAVLVSSDIDFSYDMPTHTISFSIKDITGHVHNFSIDSAEFIEGRIVNTVNVVDVEDPEVPGTSIKALRIYWKAGEGENVYSDIPVRALAQIYKGIDGIKINSETLQISADNTIARVSTVNEIRNELTAYDDRLSNRLELNELSSSTISSQVDDIQTYVNELSGKNKIIDTLSDAIEECVDQDEAISIRIGLNELSINTVSGHVDSIQTYVNELSGKNKIIDTITDNIKDLSVNIVNSDTYVGEIQVNAINVLNDLDQAWKSSYGNTLSGILQHFSFAEYGKVKNNTIIKITYTNINEAGAEGDRRKLCNLKYVTDDGIVFTDNDYIIIHGNAEYLRIEELTPNNIKYLNAIKMYQFYQLSNTVFDEFVWLSGENTEENNHAISGTNQFIGNMIVDGTSFVTNKLSVNADSVVAQVPVTLSSTLSVAGTSTLSSDVSALNNMTIKKDLFAEGSATISGDVQTNSNISANGTGTIGSTLSVGNNLSVAGTGTIASTLSVGNNLSVDGSEVVNSTLSVNGNTDLNGNVSAHNNLSVTGNIVNVGKFETTDNDISVDIPVKLANTLSVANNLSVTGTGTIASTLNVEGTGTFASTLSVGNNLSVDGSEVVNSTLSVNGDTNLNGNVSAHNNLSVTGNIVNVGKFETTDNDISVDIPVKLANTLSVANNLSAKNINVETNLCVNFANIKNNGTEYSLANLSTDLSTAISGKIWIDDKVANTIPNHTSDLSIVKMTKAEFDEFALTATGLNANVLYIVDSDYIDAYGQPIKNMKMTADSVVSEGATQHYVLSVKNDIDTELANIQANYTNAINDIGYNMISSDSSLSARLNRIDNYLETATNTPAGIAATTTLLATIVDTIYPVGTVVFNNTGTQPNIPGTTWTDDGMKEIDGEMLYMFSRST